MEKIFRCKPISIFTKRRFLKQAQNIKLLESDLECVDLAIDNEIVISTLLSLHVMSDIQEEFQIMYLFQFISE
jgi:hypothetical protein